MRAVTISRFGGPDVLTLTDLPTPEPGPGQVSIDITHAAVGLADVLMRRGEFGGEPPFVPGLEVAGTVRALGDGVAGLRVGESVVTLSRPTAGGYAEVNVANAVITISIEGTNLNPALAVSVLPNFTTAGLALTTVAHLRSGDRLLVHGALGALSTAIAQIARHLGVGHVAGTVRRAEQIDSALARGYDQVLLADDLINRPSPVGSFDVVMDPVGGPLRPASLGVLSPLGRLVCVGNASGSDDTSFGGNQLWLANAAVLGLNTGGLLAEHPEIGREPAMQALEYLMAGAVATDYRTLPLDQAAQAHRQLERGGVDGRLILTLCRRCRSSACPGRRDWSTRPRGPSCPHRRHGRPYRIRGLVGSGRRSRPTTRPVTGREPGRSLRPPAGLLPRLNRPHKGRTGRKCCPQFLMRGSLLARRFHRRVLAGVVA